MPRRAKGARLWLRKAQHDKSGKLTHTAIWIIKDGRHRESTGCCAEDYRQAEDRLADYIANKRLDHVRDGIRPPAAIPVADVLALYSRDLVDKQTRPKETTRRLKTLIDYFGDKVLSDINGNLCRQYAQDRVHQVAARRELEDLRAAINHHRKEGLCSAIVEIVLPPRPLHRDRWLTRQEAAHFIRTAWRYRDAARTSYRPPVTSAYCPLSPGRVLHSQPQAGCLLSRPRSDCRSALGRFEKRRVLSPSGGCKRNQKTPNGDHSATVTACASTTMEASRPKTHRRIQWEARRLDRQGI